MTRFTLTGILPVAAAFALLATAAAAETTPAPAPALMSGVRPGIEMQPVDDNRLFAHVLFDQLEARTGGNGADFRWSGQGWLGTDIDKLWIKSEGFRRSNGSVDDGRHEFLYDRAISTYFDLQGGLRSDIDSRPTRNWAAFGLQGLAPLFFNLETTAYVSDQGHFAGRVEASYDLPITQRLILQSEVELNLYSKADPARRVGAGVSDIDTGLRLRYEITRKFAPYIGVAYDGKFGQTASFARTAGESAGNVRFIVGIRTWF